MIRRAQHLLLREGQPSKVSQLRKDNVLEYVINWARSFQASVLKFVTGVGSNAILSWPREATKNLFEQLRGQLTEG